MANTKIQSEQIADSAITTDRIAADAITTAKIADSVALGGSPTTTTQSGSDNSTKIATTEYVTSAISSLIDSAPSTLNTLNEIAAALNDDANFNTTVTNSIAAKLPLAGGTLTGDLNIAEYIRHAGDSDTNLRFQTDRATLVNGGGAIVDLNTNGSLYLTGTNVVVYGNYSSTGTISSGAITSSGNVQLNSRLTFGYNNHYFEAGTNSVSFKSNSGTNYLTINNSGISTGTISSGAITSTGTVTGTQLKAATGSTTAAVLKLEDSGVATYDFSFPDTGTILLGVNDQSGTTSDKVLKLHNAGSGTLGLSVEGNSTFVGTLSSGAITSSAGITAETGLNLESGTLVIKNSTGDSSGLRIFQDSSDASKIYNNFNGTLQLGVGNTTALTIDDSENATFAGTISSGAITSTGNITNDYNDTISMNYAPSAGSYHKGMSGTSFAAGSTARGLHLFNFDNDSNLGINFWVGTTASKQFAGRIDQSGNFAIGIDAPHSELHVEGNIGQQGTSNVSVSSGVADSGVNIITGLHASYVRGSGRLRVMGTENNVNVGYAEYMYAYSRSAGGTYYINLKFINEAFVNNTYARPRLYLYNSSSYNNNATNRQNTNQTANSTNTNIGHIGITNVANQYGSFQIVAEPMHWKQ